MKVLLLVLILACLLNATKGLKCMDCDDYFQYYNPDFNTNCNQNSNKTTHCSDSEHFCATYKFSSSCGGSTCYEKNCDYLELCESVGTSETFYLEEKVTVNCCQSDLCNDQEIGKILENVGTSVGLNKVSTHIRLFYVLFPVVVAQLFN